MKSQPKHQPSKPFIDETDHQHLIARVYQYLKEIKDPEVPVVNVVELGIVRKVELENKSLRIYLTPTYSGCPAMKMIEEQILAILTAEGFDSITIKIVLSPPWSTDWLNEETRQKLKEYGIAPPEKLTKEALDPFSRKQKIILCPFCDSDNTRQTSEFGSTACKALHYCDACHQPFEYFKCI